MLNEQVEGKAKQNKASHIEAKRKTKQI